MLLKGKILSYKGDGNRDGGREGEGETITLSRCVICALQHPPPQPTDSGATRTNGRPRPGRGLGGGGGGGAGRTCLPCAVFVGNRSQLRHLSSIIFISSCV